MLQVRAFSIVGECAQGAPGSGRVDKYGWTPGHGVEDVVHRGGEGEGLVRVVAGIRRCCYEIAEKAYGGIVREV